MQIAIGPIFANTFPLLKEGDAIEGHTHTFDHATLCIRGPIKVQRRKPDGSDVGELTLNTGEFVLVEAGYWHRNIAMADGCMYWCIFTHRDPDGNVVQQFNNWTPSYW